MGLGLKEDESSTEVEQSPWESDDMDGSEADWFMALGPAGFLREIWVWPTDPLRSRPPCSSFGEEVEEELIEISDRNREVGAWLAAAPWLPVGVMGRESRLLMPGD